MNKLSQLLRARREKLYKEFDDISKLIDIYKLQCKLADEIIESEKNKSKIEWQIHLDRIYSIGDAIVWGILNEFVIRQLGKYDSVKTSLVSQGDGFKKIIFNYSDKAKNNLFIFSDLTRCITIGDVIQVLSPENVRIIEHKTSFPSIPSATNLLQGRVGRQFSKAFWLSRYLLHNYGQLYQQKKLTRTIEIDFERKYHFKLIPNLLKDCLNNNTSFIIAETGLIYLAQMVDKKENNDIIKSLPKFNNAVLAGTARIIEEKRETIYHIPILRFPIPLKYRIMLNEVDINIIGILDLEYIKKRAQQLKYEFVTQQDGLHILKKNGKTHKFHQRFINDILINFLTVDTALKTLIKLFEKIEEKPKLTEKEKEYLKSRPKNKKEFISFLEKKYVMVELNEEGDIVEAYNMKGEKIFQNPKLKK